MNAGKTSRQAISVVIPTYNRAELVVEAIESALRQTRLPDEIVVVDDGSTDDTLVALKRFGASVTIIAQPNRGRSAARNAGLCAARGDLIVFLDSDDLLTEDSLERRAQILETTHDVDVVYGDMFIINAAGQRVGVHRDYMPGPRPSGYIFAELALRCFILMPAMIRRTALGEHRFDERLSQAEDYDLWRRVAAHSRFRYVETPIACYRIHDTNTITAQPQQMQECDLEVQSRFIAMPAFGQLNRQEQSRVYRSHGAKRAALGHVGVARHFFARAVRKSPSSATSHALLLSSVLAPRMLRRMILERRRVTRKHLSHEAGPSPIDQQTMDISVQPVATS
jgi:hypothetical protein